MKLICKYNMKKDVSSGNFLNMYDNNINNVALPSNNTNHYQKYSHILVIYCESGFHTTDSKHKRFIFIIQISQDYYYSLACTDRFVHNVALLVCQV